MVPWIRFDAYKTADGQIDWPAVRAARLANGEICTRCGTCIVWPSGHRSECSACQKLNLTEELNHDRLVRCPHCGNSFDPSETDYYELYGDGEHTVNCFDCGKDFTVETSVSYTFTSPPLKTSDNQDEEEDE